MRRSLCVLVVMSIASPVAQPGPHRPGPPSMPTLSPFQALLRFDTSDPPGLERDAVDYLEEVLPAEGMSAGVFERGAPANLVARIKGAAKAAALLVDTRHRQRRSEEWTFPPFGHA